VFAAIFRALRLRAAALAERDFKLVEAGHMGELKHSRHCVGGSNYHYQFTPKYRRPVFWGTEARNLVKAVILMKLSSLGIELGAIEFGPDHVHLFLKNCEKYTVPELAGKIKGFSSYYLRKNYNHLFRRYLWGNSFWSDGYFYESIGRVTSDTIEYYIKHSQGKHWMHDNADTNLNAGGAGNMEQSRLERFGA
jgi:putative transposase